MKNLSRLQLPFWLGLLAVYTAQGQTTLKDARSSGTNYFYRQPTGSYKYGFKGSNGFVGKQSADARNEVHGYYSYFEQDTPYKVRYSAGTQGFRPQVLTRAFKNKPMQMALQRVSKGSDDLMETATKQSKRFVVDAVKMMQSQPMQISFNSQHNFLKDKFTRMEPNKQAVFSSLRKIPKLDIRQRKEPLRLSYDEKQNYVNDEEKYPTSQRRFMDKSKKLLLSKKHFVQEALKAMQTQPLQISFNSQHGLLKGTQPLNFVSSQQTVSKVMNGSTARSATQQSHNFVQDAVQTMQLQPIQLSFNSQSGLLRDMKYSKFTPDFTALDTNDKGKTAQMKYAYNFAYNTDNSARSESSDNAGRVRGQYSYYDEAGFHDLAYKAGPDGFVVLGGNLVNKNQ